MHKQIGCFVTSGELHEQLTALQQEKPFYLTLVRSDLDYATQIWTPQSIELLLKLEKPQRRATK